MCTYTLENRFWRRVGCAVFFALIFILAGCGGGDGSGSTHDAGLLDSGQCLPGEQGCACLDEDRCASNANGEELSCVGGICEATSCVAGSPGCVCRSGSECDGAGQACVDGFCASTDCDPGAQDCVCDAGVCEGGLFCQNGTVCVDATGYEGGRCLPNGTCQRGARCDTTLDVCVHCEAGSAGCNCNAEGSCSSGLACAAGRCVEASELPPSDPACYTPCRDDLVAEDGSVRHCSAEGLMRGCIGEAVCVDGSCVRPGEEKPSCASELDCPSFQTCMMGGCYSNCEIDADCPTGLGCYQKVCRTPCIGSNPARSCSSGESCEAPDGQNGYCMAVSEPDPEPIEPPSGGFRVSTSALRFSNINDTQTLRLESTSQFSQDVTIRKLEHTLYYEDGTSEVVRAPIDPVSGAEVACTAAAGECPLSWLSLSDGQNSTRESTLALTLRSGCTQEGAGACPTVAISGAGLSPGVRWQGKLEVVSGNARVVLTLNYVERPEGQWAGTMHYFGSFEDQKVDRWLAGEIDASEVPNGLIAKWDAFRDNRLNEGWTEMRAILNATRTESWKFANVADKCDQIGADACYPYTNQLGVRAYVQDLASQPIPSGVVEFPIALNLKGDPDVAHGLRGRIVSNRALHYPANPAISLAFAADPADPNSCDPAIPGDCVVFLSEMSATINVGGRYRADSSCADGYTPYLTPWLVDGFVGDTYYDQASAQRYMETCRDSELPYDTTADGDPRRVLDNENLALANPIPDGLPRTRQLELLDGALINQTHMVVLFRERFESFIPTAHDPQQVEEAAAYGYMILQRSPANLEPQDFEGAEAPATQAKTPVNRGGATCSADLLDELVGKTSLAQLSPHEREQLVGTLIDGSRTDVGFSTLNRADVHYYCADADVFNSGPTGDVRCPEGSRVVYFFGDSFSFSASWLSTQVCQSNPELSCEDQLNAWLATGRAAEPMWKCTDGSVSYCNDDRHDLRDGKTFYEPTASTRDFLLPIQPLIESAFRYKIRFQSDDSGTLGFAPDICVPNSNQKPYCFDPAEIAEVRERVDCLVALYSDTSGFGQLSSTSASRVNHFLRQSFSKFDGHDGFERLYAELLIMLGDDALTQAYSSRFDLAATQTAPFEGSKFEAGGIDLSGVAGAQMRALYASTQYYQMALDRLYNMGPNFARALERGSVGSAANFVSQQTVTLYLERLVRGATQKAQAWGEIANSYQALNRPDLARTVIERAYAATYLESALLSNLMQSIDAASPSRNRDQIRRQIERAQLSMRSALRDMRGVHESITHEINYFGFAPDYIPFPALDVGNSRANNAFVLMRQIAEQKVALAKQRELDALAASSQQRGDHASFQSELISVRNTYENNLARLCGTFVGDDGQTYPAIKKYAHLSELTSLLGDPCGRMPVGEIYQARGALKDSALAVQQTVTRFDNVLKEIELEQGRLVQQCELVDEVASFKFEREEQVIALEEEIAKSRATMNLITGGAEAVVTSLGMIDCGNPISCKVTMGLSAAALTASIAATTSSFGMEYAIAEKQSDVQTKQASVARWEMEKQCDFAEIESNKLTKSLALQLDELELEALRGEYAMQRAAAQIKGLINEAKRWESQQAEAEQMLINVAAARNDPNVRIYRNDAVINADIAFKDAVRAVYRTTRVFEYYTSQSYAGRQDLFLIRMVTAGQKNLENYLIGLDNAFFDFEEQYGNPSDRVMVLSLRDDILQIPLLNGEVAYTSNERNQMLRERLRDPGLLDENGYLNIPFSTQLERLSPLTRNHKIHYIEADIVGSGTGDNVGRLYLKSDGTGVVHRIDEEFSYYVFPTRTAVINPFFNGNRAFDPTVYRNFRLRDRPLVNTSWQLVFNQRDEQANRDIDLGAISDIRLLIYYSDFTAY